MRYQLTIDDYIGDWGYSKRVVSRVLKEYEGKHIDVRISSLGGDLNHGLDIMQQFADHGDVTVYLTGFVASAATVIAMGAKRIIMSKYAMFLVHKCSNYLDVWGSYNADQMEALIQELTENKQENDKIDVVLAQLYAKRCGKQVSEILDTLKRGRWLTAQEAFDMGFIDEILDDSSLKTNASADLLAKFCAIGLPVDGLMPAVDIPDNAGKNTQTPKDSMKKTYNFAGAQSELKLDAITPDNDGYVSVTAEHFEQLSKKIDSLTAENTRMASEATASSTRISELEEQVENLKKNLPADDTDDIKDDAVESISSKQLFDSISAYL